MCKLFSLMYMKVFVIRVTKGTNPLCSHADAALLNQAEQK